MSRAWIAASVLALCVLTPRASAQTYEELKKENEALKARIQALEADMGVEGVVVSYDAASGRLAVRIGDKERSLELKPRTHVHDVQGYEVPVAERAAKLTPGTRIGIVEEDGQLVEINIGGAHKRDHKHDHKHDASGQTDVGEEWRCDDPYFPGSWKPSDEYRPYSWMAPPSQGFCRDLFCGQFVETHRTPSGTPWVHPFTIETPHQHRDLFFIYKYAKNAEGERIDEHEAELHIDWGLTRRFGILLAVPYLGLVGQDEQATGFGDLEIAPRITFIESDRFYLAANIFMTIPTGDEDRDLGAGEVILAPFLTTWHDLGSCGPWTNWNTAFVNFGPEIGLESGDKSLLYTVVYAHSVLGPKVILPHQHGNGASHRHGNGNGNSHAHNQHAATGGTISPVGPGYPPGLTSFIVEFNGQTELQGDRLTFLQLLTGFSYVLTDTSELRFGVNFPLNHRELQTDYQLIIAFSHIF